VNLGISGNHLLFARFRGKFVVLDPGKNLREKEANVNGVSGLKEAVMKDEHFMGPGGKPEIRPDG